MRWNTFSHLADTKKYFTGRLIRSPLWQRFTDTFRVFYGSFLKNDLGVLDYLFVLPRISQNIALEVNRFNNPLAIATTILLGLAALILNIVKILSAVALTIVVSPFILLTHLFANLTFNKLSDKIKHLQIKLAKPSQDNERLDAAMLNLEDKEKKLGQVFNSTASIEGLLIKPIYKESFSDHEHYYFGSPGTAPAALGLFEARFCGCNGPFDKHPLDGDGPLQAVIEVKPENKDGIESILKTNTFWATEALEESGALEVTQKQLGLTN